MNDILSCFSGEDAPVPVHVHLNNASMIKMLTLTKPNKILPMQCNARCFFVRGPLCTRVCGFP